MARVVGEIQATFPERRIDVQQSGDLNGKLGRRAAGPGCVKPVWGMLCNTVTTRGRQGQS